MTQQESSPTDAEEVQPEVQPIAKPSRVGVVDEDLAAKLEMATLCDRRTARKFLRGDVVGGRVGERLRAALAAFRMSDRRSKFPG